MARVVMLGTGSALSGPRRENTYMLVEGKTSRILVDCAGSPAQRLAAIGVDIHAIDTVILTHADPDHIYGWPIFALNAWMAGRRAALHVYGLSDTVRSARAILRAVGSFRWPHFYPVRYHVVDPSAGNLILTNRDFAISATMTEHFVPTIALRFTGIETGRTMAYSSDTTPTEQVVELARGAKYLIHEATTLNSSTSGHSSALQAGAQARRAGAERLVLVHLPPDLRPRLWQAAAREEFAGPVIVARDLQEFSF